MTRHAFVAATWNMGGGEQGGGPTPAEAREQLREIREAGATILLGQEVQEQGDRSVLHELGMRLDYTRPESLVAWDPEVWTPVYSTDVVLNPDEPYFRKGGTTPVYVRSRRVILCDRRGRSVDCLSYHTPSSVQEANPPERRIDALRQSMATLTRIAEHSEARAVLFGGDDNVEESGAYSRRWAFMRRKATGLQQVVAPADTLGKRRVDDFRIRGLEPVGPGRVLRGPTQGDGGHGAHVRRFAWKDTR